MSEEIVENIDQKDNAEEIEALKKEIEDLKAKNTLNELSKNDKKEEGIAVDDVQKSRTQLQKEAILAQENDKKTKDSYKESVKFVANIKDFLQEKKEFLPLPVLKNTFLDTYKDLADDPETAEILIKVDLMNHIYNSDSSQENLETLTNLELNKVKKWLALSDSDQQKQVNEVYKLIENTLNTKELVARKLEKNSYSTNPRIQSGNNNFFDTMNKK